MNQMEPLRLVTQKELKTRFGLPYSRVHYDRMEKAGKFPQRVYLSDGRIAYVEREIVEWIANRINRRRQPTTLAA